MIKLASTSLVLFLAAGCASSVEGDWQSDTRLANGEKNEMRVDPDFTGKADLWAAPASNPGAFVKFEFDVEWEDDGGGEFDFEMTCDEGPCDGTNDFKMTCDFLSTDTGEKLDCEGDGRWSSTVLQWERDE